MDQIEIETMTLGMTVTRITITTTLNCYCHVASYWLDMRQCFLKEFIKKIKKK